MANIYVPKYQTLEEIMVKSFQVGCACNICGPDYAGPDVQGQTFKLLPSIHNGGQSLFEAEFLRPYNCPT